MLKFWRYVSPFEVEASEMGVPIEQDLIEAKTATVQFPEPDLWMS